MVEVSFAGGKDEGALRTPGGYTCGPSGMHQPGYQGHKTELSHTTEPVESQSADGLFCLLGTSSGRDKAGQQGTPGRG